jgi:hypothetical protein
MNRPNPELENSDAQVVFIQDKRHHSENGEVGGLYIQNNQFKTFVLNIMKVVQSMGFHFDSDLFVQLYKEEGFTAHNLNVKAAKALFEELEKRQITTEWRKSP